MAHITGGGLPENLPRCLGGEQSVEIQRDSWVVPPIFNWLAEAGQVSSEAMFDTFNMGIGFTLIVPKDRAKATVEWFSDRDIAAFEIGRVVAGDGTLSFINEQ